MIPPFVNRNKELRKLFQLAEKGHYPVLYVYGPEGCGKTRLLKEFISIIKNKEDYIAIYVDAQVMKGELIDVIFANTNVFKLIKMIAEPLIEYPLGKSISLAIPYIMRKVCEKIMIRGKHLVIAVDDVAVPLGLNIIEVYAKKLLDTLEYLTSKNAESVLIVATTSEGFSRSLLLRHNYVSVEALWNLSQNACIELAKKLSAPPHLYEDVWRWTGGNPRRLIELSKRSWKIEEWLMMSIKRKLGEFLQNISKNEKEYLRKIINDIDEVMEHRNLLIKMLNFNLITPIDRPCMGYTPQVSRELGIGEYYAWQIPAYRILLKSMLNLNRV